MPSSRERVFSFEPDSTALPALDPLPLPADIRQVVIYDDNYLEYWPQADLPVREVAYDDRQNLAVASVPPGGGCLTYAYQRLAFHPAGTPACAPADPATN